jgi:hypothetical protein
LDNIITHIGLVALKMAECASLAHLFYYTHNKAEGRANFIALDALSTCLADIVFL